MCGIAGFVDLKKRPEKRVLNSQLDQIVYRGPDARGVYVDQHAALGVQRLSIIDLQTGDQPIFNEDGSLVVVFNGEIYNYQDLRRDLVKKGHRFKTKSDTEILVHLYEEYGITMPTLLNGMFAFAIWDNKKHELFLVRDQIGVKPLYYFHQGGLLVFGSEIKSLLKHPQIKREVNPESVVNYAKWGYVGGEYSIFKKIKKLIPGTSMRFTGGKISHSSFWKLSITLKNPTDSLERLLFQAIKLQSVADVPVGVFLSGGLDSSLLLHYLSRVQRKKIHSFSVGFRESSFDESSQAETVANQLQSIHHTTYLTADELPRLFQEITQKLDEPLADSSLFPTYKVSQFARKFVKVVLSGDGGDELFGGYPTYQGHLLASRMPHLPQTWLSWLQRAVMQLPASHSNYPLTQILAVFLEDTYLDPLSRHQSWMRSLFGNAQGLLNSQQQDNGWDALKREVAELNTDDKTQVQALDIMTYLRDCLLVKADRASMYSSLELRVPYLDPELIRYAFSLPAEEKFSLRESKKPLRALARTIFPAYISERKKKGFGIPLAAWFHKLMPQLKSVLGQPDLYEFFDREKVMVLIDNFRGQPGESRQLWLVLVFSHWLKQWGNS